MNKPSKRKYSGKYDAQLKITIAREYLTTDLGYRALGVIEELQESYRGLIEECGRNNIEYTST